MQHVRKLASYYRQSHLHLLGGQGARSRQLSVVRRLGTSTFEQACRHLTGPAPSPPHLPMITTGFPLTTTAKGEGSDEAGPPPPAPGKPSFYTWAKWALGSLVALFLPFWMTRFHWQRLLLFGSEVEKAVMVAETTAEIVEEVAAAAEKVAEEVAEKLPEGGKLKQAALAVENASKAAVSGAETVEDIIHKVDELEQEVETLLKPVMDPTKGQK